MMTLIPDSVLSYNLKMSICYLQVHHKTDRRLVNSVSHGSVTSYLNITKTRLFKYIENFTSKKTENFQIKNSDIFHISAQNIDCGYSLVPPQRGGSNEYPQSMV